ncbi:MAG: c-type cytochrome [Alphaproteobacteria bacterium]|nr:c-type cytochrome [Alphaproteobacteria bacterium]
MFGAMPADFNKGAAPSKELVDLGRMLYFDTRLSKGNEVSCNSCHGLDTYGVDGKPVSEGIGGQKGGRNSPTVYAAAGQFVQFWDGRAADVEEQAKGPVLNPVEMGMADGDAVMKKLGKIPGYVDAFKAAFPGEADPMTYDNLGKAIGAFERGLVTHDSKFDKYMGGQMDALSAEELAGLDLFVSTGCTACHSGPLFGGTMYQKLGSVVPYETADTGRMQVTNNEADKFMFKVPTLVNVAKTAPYFHDGMVVTLDDAVVKMAKHQLGKDLSAADAASISLFLNTLTGELPTDYIAMPTLPEGEEKGAKAGGGGGGGGGSKAKGKAKAN